MRPVKTKSCNLNYRGPSPEIGDLWVYRPRPHEVFSFFKPSEVELQILNEGGAIELGLFYEPIPPVSLNVVRPEEIVVTDPSPSFKLGEADKCQQCHATEEEHDNPTVNTCDVFTPPAGAGG